MHHPTAETSVRKYYLGVLIIWSALSVAGNALHAIESHSGILPPVLCAIIATIPPITFFMESHGVVLQLGTPSGEAAAVRWFGIMILVVIITCSMGLSFTALRELAVMAGFTPGLSPLMAVIIDVPVVHASLVMYVEARVAAAREGVSDADARAHNLAGASVPEPDPDPVPDPPRGGGAPVDAGVVVNGYAAMVDDSARTEPVPHLDAEPVHAHARADHGDSAVPREFGEPGPHDMRRARNVRAQRRTKYDDATVALALMLVRDGHTHEQAGEAIGVSHSTITRWVQVADQADALHLATPKLSAI